jgi:uncharacterized membrane protein YdfJ with MMPL/SSD domain
MKNDDVRTCFCRIEAVKANIQAMAEMLSAATARAAEAATRSANERNQNGAIGTLIGIDQDLESVLALYRAALALHRSDPTLSFGGLPRTTRDDHRRENTE